LPTRWLIGEDKALQVFAAGLNRVTEGLSESLSSLLADVSAEDFVAVLAWIERSEPVEELFARLRAAITERSGAATSLGFGPRYLHSTGQYFKAGPNRGRFLLVTCEEKPSIPIPGRPYDFAALESAQARGDFEVLAERGRQVVQVHFLGDALEGLRTLLEAVEP
jgi:transaldolase/glucose-6-phosphate isomerase